MTALVLAAGLGVIGILWTAHLHGRLHRLSSAEVPPETAAAPRPGGQDFLDLHRITPGAGVTPQFTGLTLLPGVGMGILQVTLDVPGHEPVAVFPGTSIEKLASVLQPFTNMPTPALQFTPFSLRLLPAGGSGDATELLGTRPASQVRTDLLPGGTGATATFAAVSPPNVDGTVPPPSPLETSVTPSISDRGLELSIATRNVSEQPQRVDVSWSPKFLLAPGGLEKLRITGPQTTESHGDQRSVELSAATQRLHRTWIGLKQSYLSAGPELQVRNLVDGYTIRMTALTPSIRTIQVDGEPDTGYVQFRFSTASSAQQTPDTVIGPGETLKWRVRVQVMANQTYVAPLD